MSQHYTITMSGFQHLARKSDAVDMMIGAAHTVLEQHDCESGTELSIELADNERVRTLNAQFRGVDSVTDVLSFPAEMPPMPEDMDDMPPYLGDIAIAMPYARAQAERLQHDETHSLMLMVAHGVLHLLGYDHDTPDNRAEMWAAQERALLAMKVPLAIVPLLEDAPHE